jgi:hypothetical protein
MYTKLLSLTILCLSLGLISCESDTSSNDGGTSPLFSITGAIRNDNQVVIPPTARLYAIWSISSGSPDYSYLFGTGTINTVNNTFSFSLTTPPPMAALNANELGIAYLMLIDADIPMGKLDQELEDSLFSQGKFFGAINDRAIVYVNGSPDTANYNRSWVKDFNFKPGYNFGKGWYNPGPGFDGFTPDSGPIELLIDTNSEKFTFPNWT